MFCHKICKFSFALILYEINKILNNKNTNVILGNKNINLYVIIVNNSLNSTEQGDYI